MKKLLIVGAGGLGQMVQEIALLTGYDEVAFLDDAAKRPDVVGKCCDYQLLRDQYPQAVAAFGDDMLRLSWTAKLLEAGYEVPSMVHPTAFLSGTVTLEEGCLVLPRAVVNAKCKLKQAALINSGALVDHDTQVGEGAHVGLGCIVKAYCNLQPLQQLEAGKVLFSTRRKIDGVHSQALEDALYAFGFGPKCSYVKPFGAGHINETYAVYMTTEQGDELCYVLQRLNTNVFKNPAQVMQNIIGVTEYLRGVIRQEGGDPDRETLSYIKTKSGQECFMDETGLPWRCYNFIPDSVCYQSVEAPEQFYQAARSFGHFLRQLEDYPMETLTETIPDFHNTPMRYQALMRAARRDVLNRAAGCKSELAFARRNQKICDYLTTRQEAGQLPLRVTHNDTKLNNILFDLTSGQGLCIIDLDTIMPGLAANDFGDAIRFGASTAAEDEPNLDKVHFDIHLFEQYAKGYLEETRQVLTDEEKQSLAWGARLLTLECGMRFLADYLQGDVYFKTQYPTHNLVRARTQFRLCQEIEEQFDQLQEIVAKYS